MPLLVPPKPFYGHPLFPVSGKYSFLGNGANVSGGQGNGWARLMPITPLRDMLVDRIGGEVTIVGDVGSSIRMGFYNDAGIPSPRPGNLLLDAGSIHGDVVAIQERQLGAAWYTPGTAGVNASTPDSVALSITGDLTLEAEITPDLWVPATDMAIITKYDFNSQRSYQLQLLANGRLRVVISSDGAAFGNGDSTVVTGVAAGKKWVRGTVDVDNLAAGHDFTFALSDDGVNWTPLGTTLTTAGVVALFDSTTPVRLGATANDANRFAGKIHNARISAGLPGAQVLKGYFDAAEVDITAAGAPTTATMPGTNQGATPWTFNGSGWLWQWVPLALAGGQVYWACAAIQGASVGQPTVRTTSNFPPSCIASSNASVGSATQAFADSTGAVSGALPTTVNIGSFTTVMPRLFFRAA